VAFFDGRDVDTATIALAHKIHPRVRKKRDTEHDTLRDTDRDRNLDKDRDGAHTVP